MGVKLHFGFLRNWLGRIRVSYWIAALAVVLVLFDTFIKPISAISRAIGACCGCPNALVASSSEFN
jgi:hypothetical protein